MASSFRETLNEAAAVSMIQANGKGGTKERAILLHTYNTHMLTVSCGLNKEAEETSGKKIPHSKRSQGD